MEYSYKRLTVDSYIELLYKEGFQKSKYEYDQLKEIIEEIGIFRFKGYVKAFRKDVSEYSIDDVLELYNLPKLKENHLIIDSIKKIDFFYFSTTKF